MEIIDILNSSNEVITANINLLAADYLEKTGRKVCRACPSDMQYMVLTLKNIYNMTQFEFGPKVGQRKYEKGGKVTISNSTMTDENAIKFLQTNTDERIKLFSKYPTNWKDLVDGKVETEEEKTKRLAIEAEAAAVNGDAPKPSAEDLDKFLLKDLRKKYPEITAISKVNFIEKILA
jgi:hypothetical protein